MSRTLLLFCFLLTGLSAPQRAESLNRAGDVKVVEKASGGIGFFLTLEERPRYSLRPVSGNRLQLSLYDTKKTRLLEKKIAEAKGALKMEEDPQTLILRIYIPLKSPPREMRSAWLSKDKVFYMEAIGGGGEGRQKGGEAASAQVMKNIRFGVQEDFTRVVMDLTRVPQWEIVRRKDRVLSLRLEDLIQIPKRKNYGPMSRVKEVVVQGHNQGAEIGIVLDKALDHFRLFRPEAPGRFVLDLFDKPPRLDNLPILLTSGFDDEDPGEENPREPSAEPVKSAAASPLKAALGDEAVTAAEDKENRIHGEERSGKEQMPGPEGREVKSPETPGEEEGPVPEDRIVEKGQEKKTPPEDLKRTEAKFDPEEKAFVRQKIPQRPGEPSVRSKGPTPPDEGPLRIDPTVQVALKNALPDHSMVKAWSENLNPDEAFLFGRILEAWELKDYEKGVTLIEQFLAKYPESHLCERISFLRGDFRLYLLKSGRKEVLPALIESYKEAVARFPNSKEVPDAYIRMAQANFLAGNYYAAIGSLNIVIMKYPQGDHLPTAYLIRGKAYLRMNREEKGVGDFKTIFNRFPQSAALGEARFWIGAYFHNKGIYEEADKSLKEIEASDPYFYVDHPEYLFLRARNSFYQKKYESARHYFLKALNVGHQPETGDMLLSRIGDTYHHEEKKEAAEKYYNAAINQYPDSEGASIAKLRLAKYSSGVSAYQEVHQKNVNKPIGDLALLEMANRYYEKGVYAMALENLKGLIRKPT
ncbi:MAG: tetratricopeptide repeat protein, partial [Pseudomonadota bacterium]